ncbi:MAG: hypothetical protein ACD_37C00578G0003 [uncultured bacterium]|nr:MAG: hypothetical protein ACD_37C00578G0003 [uncultured bacterium]
MKKALLILPDNTIYRGEGIGPIGSYSGELVFNTSMTGYVEALTDPSYSGQILTFAYPLIGNYGVNANWTESKKIHPTAIVAGEICKKPFHYEMEQSVEAFLEKSNVGGIVNIDTRLIIKKIRMEGTVNAVVSVYDDAQIDWINEVTTKKPYTLNPTGDNTVVLIDYGVKKSILKYLVNQNLKIVVVPAMTSAEDVLSYQPAGIILSNGPGDPAKQTHAISVVTKLLSAEIPLWGICLGHQLLALAAGAKTYKLPYGHRGINQPVINKQTKKAYITSHNHGHTVDPSSLSEGFDITFVNLNDGTIEGIKHKNKPWFSVQFHPEANPGTNDTHFLFDEFKELL